MSSYSLQVKSLDNLATAFVTIDATGPQEARKIAERHIDQWARRNGTHRVEFSLLFGIGIIDGGVRCVAPLIPQPKKTLVTIEVDSNDKLHGLLEALQQYIDNSDEGIESRKQHEDVSDLAAKVNACSDVKDQLEAYLVSLAG